jgi:hypothetical protein
MWRAVRRREEAGARVVANPLEELNSQRSYQYVLSQRHKSA